MFQFGIGALFAVPVGGNLGTPSFPQRFGTIQDVSIDINQKLVELRGQYKFPDDVAPSDMEIKGKSGFGRIEVEAYNALYFADTIAAGVKKMVDGESHTVAGTTGATTPVVVTHNDAGAIEVDLGVRYKATGVDLQVVTAGSEAAGKYSVDLATGTYTFDPDDLGLELLISYVWLDDSEGRTMTITNHIQGYGPVFELWLAQPYQGDNGIHLFQCRSSKMSAPMKRDGYMIPDFEFTAFANAAGDVAEWFQTSA